jgi:hypothetical protein
MLQLTNHLERSFLACLRLRLSIELSYPEMKFFGDDYLNR